MLTEWWTSTRNWKECDRPRTEISEIHVKPGRTSKWRETRKGELQRSDWGSQSQMSRKARNRR